jgi:hypothetical protein
LAVFFSAQQAIDVCSKISKITSPHLYHPDSYDQAHGCTGANISDPFEIHDASSCKMFRLVKKLVKKLVKNDTRKQKQTQDSKTVFVMAM